MKSSSPSSQLLTFGIVAASSVLFCSKGVFAKLGFAQGADALTMLTLRMAFALPSFVVIAVLASRGKAALTLADWGRLAGLGFIGYYVSSLVNFTGLQYVSIGLERIILYTYPSMVLIFSAVVLRKPVKPTVWVACVVAWLGIVMAFTGEMNHPVANEKTLLGSALIFASALTYGAFILFSGETIQRVGPMRFTGLAVGFSCVFMLAHFEMTHSVSGLLSLPPAVYAYGLILAIFGTVIPALLLSVGLKRAGPQKFAVISAIGPVTTLFLAWALLGEVPNGFQYAGFFLTLGGGLAISLRSRKD